jgi:16S rRNA processing protein RimM
LGKIIGAHGVRGRVRIRAFTAEPKSVAAYGPVMTETGRTLALIAPQVDPKGMVIAGIAGITDRTAAEALAGQNFSVDRAKLPPVSDPDEYYQADLVGLAAFDPEGNALGTVAAVHDFGAGAMLELDLAGGGSRMAPFTGAVAKEVDLAAGRIVLDLPEETSAEEPGP